MNPTGSHELTERKRDEVPLHADEDRSRRALQAAGAGTWEWDPRTGEATGSSEFWSLLGLAAGPCVPSFDAWLSSIHPDDRERAARAVQTAAAAGDELTLECRVATADGRTRWLLARGQADRDAEGRPTRYRGIALDITAAREEETAVRERLAELTKVFDVETVGVMFWDMTSGVMTGANDTFLRLMGYGRREVEARELTWQRLTPPEYMDVSRAEVEKFVATGRVGPYEKEYFRKDGRRQWFVFAGSSLGNDTCVEFCVDISARKRAEAELRDSEEQFRVLTQNLVSGVALIDGRGAFLIVNRSFLRLFDLDENADVLNVNSRDWREWHVFDEAGALLDVDEHPVRKAALTRAAVKDRLVAVQAPGRADRKWLLVSAEPILNAGGEVHRLICTYHDITARKAAEEAVRRANESLAEADRRKDEFIAVLSHELRNPLAPIRYAVPILAAERLSEQATRALAIVDRQVEHLTRLVDDLLDVSRITTGKIELRRAHATLASIVSVAVEAASPAISAARHSLDMTIAEEPIWLHADATRIAQVVTNLLTNSAKFTPTGGRITLEGRRDGPRAVIRVRDTGMGIPPAALPNLFEMFRQLHRADNLQGGLGIGLALARRLVEMHGGTIAASSGGIGHGAEFTVTLPVADQAAIVESSGQAVTAAGVRRLKVLIVDDNVDLVEMLALVVEAAGHDVRKALDGRSGLSAALSYQPDVALLDLGLPVVNGIEVARELRQHAETAKACLVALTGWGQAEDRERTRAAGFDVHLTKPTRPDELQQLLESIAARGAS